MGEETNKVKTYKVQIDGLNPCTHRNVESVLDELRTALEECEVKFVTIRIKEMTEEEYNQLPEWEGY